MQRKKIIVILDNIRSVHKVGSIFRTSDGAGVDEMVLVGITPTPLDRFGDKRGDMEKVALGAENSVSWKHVESMGEAMIYAKEKGCGIVAVEQDEKSIDYKEFKKPEKIAYIFGREVEGVQKDTLNQCDSIVEIPMLGIKNSLNVSVTVGIILFNVNSIL